jgi:hypothetical protein
MIVLGLILLAGVGLMVYQFIAAPLRDRSRTIGRIKSEIAEKEARRDQILADKPKLELWRKQSLPADVGLARMDYEKYLQKLFKESGFEGTTIIPGKLDSRTATTVPGKKEQSFTPLTFTVEVNGELADLVEFLEHFYRTPLLHEIKSMSISRPINNLPTQAGPAGPRFQQQPKNQLNVKMSIEALILHDADKRNELLPGVDRRLAAADILVTLCNAPSGFALMPWAVGPTGPAGPPILAVPSREYLSIAGKDIFFGSVAAPEVVASQADSIENIYLTDITYSGKWEAFLYVRFNNTKTRLRASAGFDSFRIRNDKGEVLVQGKVVRIEDRDLIFQSGDKYYSMHVGQNLEEVMRRPIDPSRLKELGLASAAPTGGGK